MKRQTGFAALVISSILCYACGAGAAQDGFELDLKELRQPPAKESTPAGGFEIDLKELRQTPAGSAKPQRHTPRRTAPPAATTAETAGREGNSSYTVRPGDHLFLILMRNYGLSNAAAERLIPEVMRLNGIHAPQGLTVGQRLTIPLLPPPERRRTAAGKKAPRAQPEATGSTRPETTATTERQVSVTAAPPCPLARAVIEQMGLLSAPIDPRPNEAAFTASSADLKLVVACGLAPQEAYTYERLLAYRQARLLAFKGDEPPHRVIEELAEQLGLSFHLADPTASVDLPLTYIFPAEAPDNRDVRLTIAPPPR